MEDAPQEFDGAAASPASTPSETSSPSKSEGSSGSTGRTTLSPKSVKDRKITPTEEHDYEAEIIRGDRCDTWRGMRFEKEKTLPAPTACTDYGVHHLACGHWIRDHSSFVGPGLPCGLNCHDQPDVDTKAFNCPQCAKIIKDVLNNENGSVSRNEIAKFNHASDAGKIGEVFAIGYLTEIITRQGKIRGGVTEAVVNAVRHGSCDRKCVEAEPIEAPKYMPLVEFAREFDKYQKEKAAKAAEKKLQEESDRVRGHKRANSEDANEDGYDAQESANSETEPVFHDSNPNKRVTTQDNKQQQERAAFNIGAHGTKRSFSFFDFAGSSNDNPQSSQFNDFPPTKRASTAAMKADFKVAFNNPGARGTKRTFNDVFNPPLAATNPTPKFGQPSKPTPSGPVLGAINRKRGFGNTTTIDEEIIERTYKRRGTIERGAMRDEDTNAEFAPNAFGEEPDELSDEEEVKSKPPFTMFTTITGATLVEGEEL